MFDDLLGDETRKNKQQKSIRCANCQKVIELGRDTLMVEKGVIGQRGPIPLSEPLHFCSESCVSNYFNGVPDEDLEKLPPRIP